MTVETVHNEYFLHSSEWKRNRAVCKGESAVKALGEYFLPKASAETDEGYKAYKKRACFVNFTGRTKNGLVGMVLSKPPSVELPNSIEYLNNSATLNGLSIELVISKLTNELLEVGRCIVVADHPTEESGASLESTKNNKAFLALYNAESLINWRETNGVLTMAVLKESSLNAVNEFEQEEVVSYRVFRINSNGYATVQVYQDLMPSSDEIILTGSDGRPFLDIPMVIIGSENNDSVCDPSPLSDICSLNLAHYRNSADHEEGVFMHGQPILHIDAGEMTGPEWVEANPDGITIGSKRGIVTQKGSVTLVQASANNPALEAMKHKEDQLIKLGAQLLKPKSGVETAEAARIRSRAEVSVLSTLAMNVEQGLRRSLGWVALFMGADSSEIKLELNRDLIASSVDAQQISSMIQLLDRGVVALPDLRKNLRKSGLITRDDEEIDADTESDF